MTDEQTTAEATGPHAHALQLLIDQSAHYKEMADNWEERAAEASAEAARLRSRANDCREGAKACDAAIAALQAAQHVEALRSAEVTA